MRRRLPFLMAILLACSDPESRGATQVKMLDNAFTHIDDWKAAQELADESETRLLHEKLDFYASRFCPAIRELGLSYQWNLAQVEYASDVVFRRQADLQSIYEALVRTAIHAVKPAQIATFLGRKHKLHVDNTEEDVDALVRALIEARGVFGLA